LGLYPRLSIHDNDVYSPIPQEYESVELLVFREGYGGGFDFFSKALYTDLAEGFVVEVGSTILTGQVRSRRFTGAVCGCAPTFSLKTWPEREAKRVQRT
jgi:hypothetical protein